MMWDAIMKVLGHIATIAAVFTVCFTFLNWVLNRKLNEDIRLIVALENIGSKEKCLPLTVKRRYCTRSEVQGILRAARIEQDQYNIPYLGETAFAQNLEKVQEGVPVIELCTAWVKRIIDRGATLHSLKQKYNTLYIHVSDEAEYNKFKTRQPSS